MTVPSNAESKEKHKKHNMLCVGWDAAGRVLCLQVPVSNLGRVAPLCVRFMFSTCQGLLDNSAAVLARSASFWRGLEGSRGCSLKRGGRKVRWEKDKIREECV